MTSPALPRDLEAALSQIERQIEAFANTASQGQSGSLESASADLRQASIALANLLESRQQAFAGGEAQARLKKIAQMLAAQREGLIRRSAGVERALQALMPGRDVPATYGAPGAGSSGALRRRYEA